MMLPILLLSHTIGFSSAQERRLKHGISITHFLFQLQASYFEEARLLA